MDFLITSSAFKKDGWQAYKAQEGKVVGELQAEGTLSVAYRRCDDSTVFGIAHGADLDAVKTQLARLPFIAHGFSDFDYVEVVPL